MKAQHDKSIPIFPAKYLKDKLSKFDLGDIRNKREIIRNWQRSIENDSIKESKEEALQADFLNHFFGEVLEYEYNYSSGSWNLNKEEKSQTDSTKSDGALGFFSKDAHNVQVVIELKDAKTDLDKPQNRQNDKRSPIEQAFSYASKTGGQCKWVIVSNFLEIRLYHANDQSRYQRFEILDLLNLDNLKSFYFLLHKDRLIHPTKKSEIEALYHQRQTLEDQISIDFYSEFKQIRWELFKHLEHENTDIEKTTLFEKAQKLLDRFMFVFFCEDLVPALIPADTTQYILDSYKQDRYNISDTQLWERSKQLFTSIDKGNPKADINKFNGGLFAEDQLLDSLVIKDQVLQKVIQIGEKYDFNSDLNVNILGHVFEQSISDIEEIKAQLTDQDFDIKKGKRKQDGIYYTPEYITKYIIEQTIGKWLDDRKIELGIDKLTEKSSKKKLLELWNRYKDILSHIKVLDPACGSGAFLNQAFDYLESEHKNVNDKIASFRHEQRDLSENLTKLILQNNIYGVDLNAESVNITKLSLWLKTAQKGRELTALDDNIKCGNSLIDDPHVSGDKAFDWNVEFPDVFEKDGFDVVIGNPPYVRQELLTPYKPYFQEKYEVYHGVCDLYVYFIEQGYRLLSKGGYYGIIVANKWMRANYGEALRRLLKEKVSLQQLIDFGDLPIFKDITTYPCILVYTNDAPNQTFQACTMTTLETENFKESIEQRLIDVSQSDLSDKSWNLTSQTETQILNKIKSQGIPLDEYIDNKVYRGILTGYNEAFVIDGETRDRLIATDPKSAEIIKPMLAGREIKRYSTHWKGNYLIWTYVGVDIDRYPAIFDHLQQYQDKLEKRSDKGKYWWELRRCAYYSEFDKPKIIYPNILSKPEFTLDLEGYLTNQKAFIIPSMDKFLLCFLNSSVSKFLYKYTLPQLRGGFFEPNWIVFKNFPIPRLDEDAQKPFIERVDIMLARHGELYTRQNKFLKLLQAELKLDTPSQKLQKWHELSFEEFLSEFKKKKIALSLSQKSEWMEFFETEQKAINQIQNIIEETDYELNHMVYALYGLTDDEINIIESN